MTEKQSECLILYRQGYRVTEIAARLGKSKSTVSTLIKNAGAPQKVLSETRCPYCESCFDYPLPDCVVDGCDINRLPPDFQYRWK